MSLFTTIKNYLFPPKVEPTFTDLNLKAQSSLNIDMTMFMAYDEEVIASIPYDLLASLSIANITTHTLWGVDRYQITFEQSMPDTQFAITMDRMSSTKATTIWFQVEQFYPTATADWDNFMTMITSDTFTEAGPEFTRAYYCDRVSESHAVGVPSTDVEHESVWKRTTKNGLIEFFKIQVVDHNCVQYWIGYELSPSNVQVNY